MKKRSICIITPARFPGTAGDSATLTELINELISQGFDVTLICPKTTSQNDTMHSNQLEIFRIPYAPPRLNEISQRITIKQILRFMLFLFSETLVSIWAIKRNSIKFVILRPSLLTLQLPWLLRILRIKVIADMTEFISDSLDPRFGKMAYRLVHSFEKNAIRYYTFIKVSSQSQTNLLKSLGIPDQKIIYMPFSINLSNIPYSPLSEIPENTFGYFGVLESWQGVDLLVEAFRLLHNKIPSAKLYIIGDGSLAQNISAKVKECNLTATITLVKSLPREVLWETYFKKFRTVVIPRPSQKSSIDNILPIKLIEAMGAGKPVIASDIPIMREIPEGAILLFKEGDPHSLASAMEQLCTDLALLKKLSENGATLASKYDIRINIKKITSLLGGTEAK